MSVALPALYRSLPAVGSSSSSASLLASVLVRPPPSFSRPRSTTSGSRSYRTSAVTSPITSVSSPLFSASGEASKWSDARRAFSLGSSRRQVAGNTMGGFLPHLPVDPSAPQATSRLIDPTDSPLFLLYLTCCRTQILRLCLQPVRPLLVRRRSRTPPTDRYLLSPPRASSHST